MRELIAEIKNCKICEKHLPSEPKPVLSAHPSSKIAIIGQAPGIAVQNSGIPWDDKSGQRLRQWLDVNEEVFYNPEEFAIIPMGFCYPGKGKSGDLPPRKECAPHWHIPLLLKIQKLQLTLLIGSYAQGYYLGQHAKRTLTETVQSFDEYLPQYLPLPHPSPRNNIWLKKNPWFEADLIPILQVKIQEILES